MAKNIAFVTFICCILCAPFGALAEERTSDEYQVKAAYLLNFAKFVEWPPGVFSSPDAPITLCVLGKSPFGSMLDAIQGKIVNGRKVLVNLSMDVQNVKVCHLLFISASEEASLPFILKELKNTKILVTGDMQHFAQRGGVIGFVIRDMKIGFEINMDAARRSGITISSRLLSLARVVHDSPDGGGD
jgi:hypothetical protein